MTVGEAIAYSQKILSAAGITTARLDTLVVLESTLNIDRSRLLAAPDTQLSSTQQNVFETLVRRRSQHEPLAYLLGISEFYGRDFIVSPAVLVPRPESETMIDLLKTHAPAVRHMAAERSTTKQAAYALQPTTPADYTLSIADIGTGSGALGITASLELNTASVELLDISNQALTVARMNVIKHTTSISVEECDLLPDNPKYDILLCNLPYIPDNFDINKAAQYEPKIALFAGGDGLNVYRRLFQKLTIVRTKPLLILTEAFPDQHAGIQTIAAQSGYTQIQEDDFIQVFQLEPSSRAELPE